MHCTCLYNHNHLYMVPDTLVDEAAREASRKGENGTSSECRVGYSETERKALVFEFDGLDVDAAIAELDRWCDRKRINDPIDRKNAIYGGLKKRHGKAKLVNAMHSPKPAQVSPQVAASKLARKHAHANKRGQRRRYEKPNGRHPNPA